MFRRVVTRCLQKRAPHCYRIIKALLSLQPSRAFNGAPRRTNITNIYRRLHYLRSAKNHRWSAGDVVRCGRCYANGEKSGWFASSKTALRSTVFKPIACQQDRSRLFSSASAALSSRRLAFQNQVAARTTAQGGDGNGGQMVNGKLA